jgi:hypothetical protein
MQWFYSKHNIFRYFQHNILSVYTKHLRTGVGVRNSSGGGGGVGTGVGGGVGTGVGANNILRVDSGVDFYCLNFAVALASNTLMFKLFYRTDAYNMYI